MSSETAKTRTVPVFVRLARSAIARTWRLEEPADFDDPCLDLPGASFVTLTIDGRLRGCIGSLIARRSLREDIVSNARAAAFHDPRFPALSKDELTEIAIEVSLLSQPEPMSFTSRANALSQLRPGVDGVILSTSGHRATFLPQVWDELPEPEEFMAHLLMKAGFAPTYWSDSFTIERYTVTAYREDDS